MSKTILDLCGGTGAWSKPYKDAGYNVELITLPRYDVTRIDFDTYAMHFQRIDVHYEDTLCVLYEDLYGIFAAPPCTEFSIAKGAQPRDLKAGMDIVEACMKIIWQTQFHTRLNFWALENPRGLLRRFLGVPKYTFEQWQFGHDGVKPTDLWGCFNNPVPTIKQKPEDLVKRNPNGRTNGRGMSNPKCPDDYKHMDLTRADLRAITPAGFAKAFYKANAKEGV